MQKPKHRATVRDTPLQPLGMFAVMRHTGKAARAHFASLHPTYTSASQEAIRLLTESFAGAPELDHAFYVMEVAARFSAGPEGFANLERSE